MRALGYGFLGLLLGAIGGFWLGLMAGLIYTDLARVSCFQGLCGYVAGGVGVLGAAACGLAGALYGVHRATRRRAEPAPVTPLPRQSSTPSIS
jgi:hypothetical protein